MYIYISIYIYQHSLVNDSNMFGQCHITLLVRLAILCKPNQPWQNEMQPVSHRPEGNFRLANTTHMYTHTSHHIASHHITSHHITSLTLHYITFCITLHHITLHYIDHITYSTCKQYIHRFINT